MPSSWTYCLVSVSKDQPKLETFAKTIGFSPPQLEKNPTFPTEKFTPPAFIKRSSFEVMWRNLALLSPTAWSLELSLLATEQLIHLASWLVDSSCFQ